VAKIARHHGISCAKQGFIINKILPDVTFGIQALFLIAKNKVLIKNNSPAAATNIPK
jgi:hypothetical protein